MKGSTWVSLVFGAIGVITTFMSISLNNSFSHLYTSSVP